MFMADDAGRFSQKTIDKMHLQFGTPKYGWMEIQLSSPDKEIMLNVSDVPCDSLNSLVKVLTKLLEGSTEEVVEWSLEPEYAAWTFKRKDNEIELSVSCPVGSTPDLVFQYEAVNMIQRISQSLRELGADPVWKEDDASLRIWSWDFHSILLELLEQKLTNAESPGQP
jgi:hypothetical protein